MNAWRLTACDVVKEFPGERGQKTRALDELSFEIAAGDWIMVVGPNGSGKSTLLNLLAGRFRPDSGSVTLEQDGRKTDWHALSAMERTRYFAYIHQDPRAGSFPHLTVAENLRMASLSSSRLWRRAIDRDFDAEAAARLNSAGLADKLHAPVAELSQGQRQMVALQTAMLRRPCLLLADEHTASLDQANANQCLNMTTQLWQERGASVVMITHNPVIAQQYGTRLLALQAGRITAEMGGGDKAALSLDRMLALCGMGAADVPKSSRV